MKKLYFILISFLAFSMLLGCSKTDKTSNIFDPQQQNGEAIFLGYIDNHYLRLKMDGKEKMVSFNPDLKSLFDSFNNGDSFSFQYKTKSDSSFYLYSITGFELSDKKEPVTENNDETSQKVLSDNPLSINIHESFTFDNINSTTYKIEHIKNHNIFASIELLSNTEEIKKLRWDAAGDLKKIGTLKELKGNDIPDFRFIDSEFVFTSQNDTSLNYIIVKYFNNHLIRLTLHVEKTDNIEENNLNLWNMLANINP